jgi:hypothetical protein
MGNRGNGELERKFKAVGDTLRRAAQNVDALDLKPEAKTWLLDQFGQDRPKSNQPVTDETLGFASEIVRQQSALEQREKSTSKKSDHLEQVQGRRKSKQDGGDLPPH